MPGLQKNGKKGAEDEKPASEAMKEGNKEVGAAIKIQPGKKKSAEEDNKPEEATQNQSQSEKPSLKNMAKSALNGLNAGANFLDKNVFSPSEDQKNKEGKDGDNKLSAEDKAMIARGQKFGADDIQKGVGATLNIGAKAVNAVGNFLSGAAKLAQGQRLDGPDKGAEKDDKKSAENSSAQSQKNNLSGLLKDSAKLVGGLVKDMAMLPFNEPNKNKPDLKQDKPHQEGSASKNEGQLSLGQKKPGADRITAMLKGEFGQDKVSQGKDGHKIGLSNGTNLNLSNDKKTIGMDKCTNESIGSSMKLASKMGAASVNVDKMPQASQGMAWAHAQMNKLEVTGNYKPDKGAEDFLGKLQKQASNPQIGAHRAKGNDDQKSPVNADNAQTLAKGAAKGGASLGMDAVKEMGTKAVEGLGKAAGPAMDAGDKIKGVGGQALDAAKEMGTQAMKGINDAVGSVKQSGKQALGGVKEIGGQALDAVKGAGEMALGGAKKAGGLEMSAGGMALDGAKKTGGMALEGAEKASGLAMKAGGMALNGDSKVASAAGGMMDKGMEAVQGAASGAMKAVKGGAGGSDGPDPTKAISDNPAMSQRKSAPTNNESGAPGNEASNDNKASNSWQKAEPSQLRM